MEATRKGSIWYKIVDGNQLFAFDKETNEFIIVTIDAIDDVALKMKIDIFEKAFLNGDALSDIFEDGVLYAGDAKNEVRFQFLWEMLTQEKFQVVYELGQKIKRNEDQVGKETLKSKYASAYKKSLDALSENFSKYLLSKLDGSWHRLSKMCLEEYFSSEEFSTKLEALKKSLGSELGKRIFENIPSMIIDSDVMKGIEKHDNVLGNLDVYCEETKKIADIKCCKKNCSKYETCPVWAKMKSENPSDYQINLAHLAGEI